MKVNWIQSKQRSPDKSGYYWVQLPAILEDNQVYKSPHIELALWEEDRDAWDIIGLSEIVYEDAEYAPTHWATAELPDPPEDS